MIDTTTNEPLQVSTEEGAAPYMVLPLAQLEKVTAILNTNKVSYWVDDEVLSIDGKPEVAFINFARGSDPGKIQSLLNSLP